MYMCQTDGSQAAIFLWVVWARLASTYSGGGGFISLVLLTRIGQWHGSYIRMYYTSINLLIWAFCSVHELREIGRLGEDCALAGHMVHMIQKLYTICLCVQIQEQ